MVFNRKNAVLFASLVALTSSYPIRREVPQEHSHNAIIAVVKTSLDLNNPDGIVDPIFGLLGNAAATAGLGKITDPDCLQQATADQAFTNAKAAGDVAGQVAALQFRALERNTGKVGLASVACTAIKATNPEIAAIAQHQDPASAGAAATNKAIVLELAKQIAAVGGDPQLALATGTFAPGSTSDTTGKGNSCDTADDTAGCIVSQKLLVEDATAAEIDAAVGGISGAGSAATSASNSTSTDTSSADCSLVPVTVTVTVSAAAATATDAAATTSVAAAATTTAAAAVATSSAAAVVAASTSAAAAAATATPAAATGSNLQTFTGALGGAPPPITTGGKGFVVEGNDFLNIAAAIGRSCDIQHNTCANAANSGGGFSVNQCDTQDTACKAAATA